ncbi:MAG: hypothetical protein ACREUL_18595 [Steroidobacteraceae bacterium]
MEQSLTMLTAQHELLGRKMATVNTINQDSIALLKDRQTALLLMADTEQTVSQRAQLAAQIRAAEARSAIQSEETQLRLKRMSNDLTERQIALTQLQASAQRDLALSTAKSFAVGGFVAAGVGAAGLYGLGKLAGAGLPIGVEEARLRISGALSGAQVEALAQRTKAISERLAVVNWREELGIATGLYSTLRPELASRMLGPISTAADLLKLLGRGSDLALSAGQVARTANLLGASTAGGATAVSTAIANVLRQAGPGVDMGQFSDWATYVAGNITGNTVTQRAQQLEQWGLLASRYGGLQGGFSGRNIGHLLQMLNHPANARQLAARGYLETYGLSHEEQGRTAGNILESIRRAESANKGGTVSALDLLMGQSRAVTMLHQINMMSPGSLKAITESWQHNLTLTQMWTLQMSTASAQLEQLNTNLGTLGQTLGHDMDPAVATLASNIDSAVLSIQHWVDSAGPERIKAIVEPAAELFGMLAAGGLIVGVGALARMAALFVSPALLAGAGAIIGMLELIERFSSIASSAGKTIAQHPVSSTALAIARYSSPITALNEWFGRELGAIWLPGKKIEVHHTHEHTVTVKGKAITKETAMQLAEGLRRAITAAPNVGTPVAESPHLHGGT